MKVFALFIAFLFQSAFSHENCGHNPDGMIFCAHKLDEGHHHQFQDVLEWWAASPEQVRNAKCNNPTALSEKEMKKFLESKGTHNKVSESFHGMDFVDEDPYLLELLKLLTTYSNPYDRLTGKDKEKQTKFEIPQGCKKVMCAANSLFGEKNALRFLYTLGKYNMNMSHFQDEDLAPWETKEVDLILESLDDLPPTLFPFDEHRRLMHFKRGYAPQSGNTPDGAVIANAQIMVFSYWETILSKEEQMTTIIHEIGHNIGSRFELDDSKEWLDISGWEETEGKWKATKDDTIISEYGSTNPFEDFAESTLAYRYNGENLKKRSPEKYDFIKKYVYQGLEFDKEENCQIEKSKISSYLKDFSGNQVPEDGFKFCEKEFATIFHGGKSSFKNCLSQAKMKTHLESKIQNDPEVKGDKKYQELIMNSLKNLVPEVPVTKEEEEQVQVIMTEKMMNHFKQRFSSVLGCDQQKKNGWMNISAFNKEVSGESFKSKIDEEAINEFSYKLCSTLPAKQWKAECSDLVPFFKEFLPDSYKNKVGSKKIKNQDTCKF